METKGRRQNLKSLSVVLFVYRSDFWTRFWGHGRLMWQMSKAESIDRITKWRMQILGQLYRPVTGAVNTQAFVWQFCMHNIYIFIHSFIPNFRLRSRSPLTLWGTDNYIPAQPTSLSLHVMSLTFGHVTEHVFSAFRRYLFMSSVWPLDTQQNTSSLPSDVTSSRLTFGHITEHVFSTVQLTTEHVFSTVRSYLFMSWVWPLDTEHVFSLARRYLFMSSVWPLDTQQNASSLPSDTELLDPYSVTRLSMLDPYSVTRLSGTSMAISAWSYSTCHQARCLIRTVRVMRHVAWSVQYVSWGTLLDPYSTCHEARCFIRTVRVMRHVAWSVQYVSPGTLLDRTVRVTRHVAWSVQYVSWGMLLDPYSTCHQARL